VNIKILLICFCLAFRRISKKLFVHFYVTPFLWESFVTRYVFTVRGY